MDGWPSEERLLFHWDVQDTLQRQDLLLDIRHDQTYPYSNLYVFLTYRYPNGRSRMDTVECTGTNERESGAEVVWRPGRSPLSASIGHSIPPSRTLWAGGPARDEARPHSGSGQCWIATGGPSRRFAAVTTQPEGRLACSSLAGCILSALQESSTERLMKPTLSLQALVAIFFALTSVSTLGQHQEHDHSNPCGLHDAGRALFLRRPELRALSSAAKPSWRQKPKTQLALSHVQRC